MVDIRRLVSIVLFVLGIVIMITVFVPKMSLAFSDTDRDTSDVVGWDSGAWVADEFTDNRYPAMAELPNGNYDLYWTSIDTYGFKDFKSNYTVRIVHRWFSPDHDQYGPPVVVAVAKVPGNKNGDERTLRILDLFTNKQGDRELILAVANETTDSNTTGLYFLKIDINGNVLVPLKSIPGQLWNVRNDFDATMDGRGNIHVVYAGVFLNDDLPEFMEYYRLDGNGTVIEGPVGFGPHGGYADLVETWEYPHIIVIGNQVYIVNKHFYFDLSFVSFGIDDPLPNGLQTTVLWDTNNQSLISWWPRSDLYNFIILDLLKDPTDDGSLIAPLYWPGYPGYMGLFRFNLTGGDVEINAPLYDITPWSCKPSQIGWKLGIDASGTINIIWDINDYRYHDPMYYSSLNLEGRAQGWIVRLTAPSVTRKEFYNTIQTPFVLFKDSGQIIIVYDSPHLDQWKIGYISNIPTPDLSVAIKEIGPNEGRYINEGESLNLTIVVSNIGQISAQYAKLQVTESDYYHPKEITYCSADLINLDTQENQSLPCALEGLKTGEHLFWVEVENTVPKEARTANNYYHFWVQVHPLPVARLMIEPASAHIHSSVSFGIYSYCYGCDFTYILDFGDGSITEWKDGPAHEYHQYNVLGTYYPSLKIKDNLGIESTWTTVRLIVYNNPPIVTIFTPMDGAAVDIKSNVYLSPFEYQDPDGDSVHLEWRSDVQGVLGSTPSLWVWLVPGDHNITLKVWDEYGASAEATVHIFADKRPIANLSSSTKITDRRTQVTFSGQGSFGNAGPFKYMFSFGDNTSTGWQSSPDTTHLYSHLGMFFVQMMVKDKYGYESGWNETKITVVNLLPNATLSIENTAPRLGEEVLFHLRDLIDPDGSLYSITFRFGDGTIGVFGGDFLGATHAYNRPGTYIVSVVIMDNNNGFLNLTGGPIVVRNELPRAYIGIDKLLFSTDEDINLDANASWDIDGRIVHFIWSFGDSQDTIYEKVVVHSYTRPGGYTIQLKVIDDQGAENTTSLVVTIIARKDVGRLRNFQNVMADPLAVLFAIIGTMAFTLVGILGLRQKVAEEAGIREQMDRGKLKLDSIYSQGRNEEETKQLLENKREEAYRYFR